MTEHDDQINQLRDQLESLLRRQNDFSREIDQLRIEINRLKAAEETTSETPAPQLETAITEKKEAEISHTVQQPLITGKSPRYPEPPASKTPNIKSNLEKFIGENLINKIGIVITIIGVAIGVKYSIEHNLLSPLTRIILAYLVGTGLGVVGLKLRAKYENFSAVLVSGAMAIMYLITYSAYAIYELIPQVPAFVMMVIFTVFTVTAAIVYNRQVIAHIGLVGAYAIPFLLSEDSGRVAVLFSYMTLINAGILVLSLKKYWKPLYYSSFGFTWLIYIMWYATKYRTSEHFGPALTFVSLFFITFYTIFLAYKLIKKEAFKTSDILLLLSNSFIFYAIGYSALNRHPAGENLLGLFTLVNALIHLIVGAVIYRQKLPDKNLFFLVAGLALVYITIAIPVQFDGSWVTLLWAGETALLFGIGRTKKAPVYEKLSYPILFLAFLSIIHDWATAYGGYVVADPETRITPLFNIHFLCSMLVTGAFALINFLHRRIPSALKPWQAFQKIMPVALPAIFLFTLYYSFRIEIANYWNQLYTDSFLTIDTGNQQNYYRNHDLESYKTIWVINYSLFFVSVLSFFNIKKLRDEKPGYINLGLNVLTIIIFLTQGLYTLSELRESYLTQNLSEYYQRGVFNIGIRYLSGAFMALALTACYQYIRSGFIRQDFRIAFDFLLYGSVLWMASSEIINWMDLAGSTQSYKLGLSIGWGTYSLLLIVLGIWKKKKHLRVGAITLFGVTLVKLFFYDISHLDTLAKTIVFISLGILLLIISFLYNKYKHIISGEN
ncbi:DUF2339 domain-containing protein [Gaoshiqia sp. Z1-71]|uniref:DUF2339 domain-containing protein n=1 Tax=Gaoshiqia hydrogeniformans TaxID=3290090 RepID=UPI003BF823B0